MRTILRVFAYVRRYPWMAAGTILCAIITTLMLTVFPKVTQLVIDEVRRSRRNVLRHSLMALAALLRDLFNGLRIVLTIPSNKVIFDLRSDLYAHPATAADLVR